MDKNKDIVDDINKQGSSIDRNAQGGMSGLADTSREDRPKINHINKTKKTDSVGSVGRSRHSSFSVNTVNMDSEGRHDTFKILNELDQEVFDPSTNPLFPKMIGRAVNNKDPRTIVRWSLPYEDFLKSDLKVKANFKVYQSNTGVVLLKDIRDYVIYKLWTCMRSNMAIDEVEVERILTSNLRENLSKGELYRRSVSFGLIAEMAKDTTSCFAALAILKHGCESSYVAEIVYRADITNMTDYNMFRALVKTMMKWDDNQVPGVKNVIDSINLKLPEYSLASNPTGLSVAGMVDYICNVATQVCLYYSDFTVDPSMMTSLIEMAVVADLIESVGGEVYDYDAIQSLMEQSKHPLVEILRGTPPYWNRMDRMLEDIRLSNYVDEKGSVRTNSSPAYTFTWFDMPKAILDSNKYKVMLESLKTYITSMDSLGHYQLYTKTKKEDSVRSKLTDIWIAPRQNTVIQRFRFLRNIGDMRLLTRNNIPTVAEHILDVVFDQSLPEYLKTIYDKMAYYNMTAHHSDVVVINSDKVSYDIPDTDLTRMLLSSGADECIVRQGVILIPITTATPLTAKSRASYRAIETEKYSTYLIPMGNIDEELLSRQSRRLEYSGLRVLKDYPVLDTQVTENMCVQRRMSCDKGEFTIDTNMLVMYDKERNVITEITDWVPFEYLVKHRLKVDDIVSAIEASTSELIMKSIILFMTGVNEDLDIPELGLCIPHTSNNKKGLSVIRKDFRLLFSRDIEHFYASNSSMLLSPRHSSTAVIGVEECATSIVQLYLTIVRMVTGDTCLTDDVIRRTARAVEWNLSDLDMKYRLGR